MPWAQFEEKQYETVVAVELAEQGAFVFSSGQVLEKVVGYDVAAAPTRDHVIWQILEIPRPRGVHLAPPIWARTAQPDASQLPVSPISLLLQYKRPEYLRGARAAQWRLWREPYFRFTRDDDQHRVLRRLERQLGGDAAVRYAAPAFWQLGELESAHLQRIVIPLSGFVQPTALDNHRVWTYTQAGRDGLPNPRGRPARFQTFREILQSLETRPPSATALMSQGEPLFTHLRLIGAVARQREPRLRRMISEWRGSLQRADLGLRVETLERLVDIASVSSLVHRMGGTWHVVDTGSSSFTVTVQGSVRSR